MRAEAKVPPVGGLSNIHVLRSPSPLPSPHGEGDPLPLTVQSGIDLMRTGGGSPSLSGLGGRLGVRGNVIDSRNEPHKCRLQLPTESVEEPKLKLYVIGTVRLWFALIRSVSRGN